MIIKKRAWSLLLGFLGLVLLIISLGDLQMTGSAIGTQFVGVNLTSKIIGAAGILLMIAALVIENYEAKKLKIFKNKVFKDNSKIDKV